MIFETISLDEANALIENGACLVDVRSNEEYGAGHMKGSINIPHTEILNKAERLLKDKNKPVILYCSAAKRSKQAWDFLRYLGYEKVYALEFQNLT